MRNVLCSGYERFSILLCASYTLDYDLSPFCLEWYTLIAWSSFVEDYSFQFLSYKRQKVICEDGDLDALVLRPP